MPNYKETPVLGTSFNRCRLIEINNPYQQSPSVIFTEERITAIPDLVFRDQPDTPIRVGYDPMAVIAIYDPVTLQPTGATVTMQDIYGLMFSSYFHYATKRDVDVLAAAELAAQMEAERLAAEAAAAQTPT